MIWNQALLTRLPVLRASTGAYVQQMNDHGSRGRIVAVSTEIALVVRSRGFNAINIGIFVQNRGNLNVYRSLIATTNLSPGLELLVALVGTLLVAGGESQGHLSASGSVGLNDGMRILEAGQAIFAQEAEILIGLYYSY